ncbi:hypothetical protein FNV43_RR19267 [Rhamnella rubrinervis]|uniref:Uncharacterized protein n=1 Tax=Rhamnella rubrinervis TaxID=2594499 RepID=A0A8K0GWS1_9ROSA|nr:hypothetical protein FNV43_RR19267 [Rhamnella rubrinervis]
MPKVGERDIDHAILFASQSGSNKLSSSRSIVDVNRSRIKDKEDSISQNEIEENTAFRWSLVNLHDRVDITRVDGVLPTIDKYDRLYNFYNYDVDYDDNTSAKMHEDIVFHDDIELKHDRKGGDDKVNDAFEVPIVINFDVPFVSKGFRMTSVPIPPTVDDSHRHNLPRIESD